MLRCLAIAGVAVALALAGCGGDDDGDPAEVGGGTALEEESPVADPEPEEPADPEPEEPAGTVVATSDSQLGEVLFDADDQAIYYFDLEQGPQSECYGECAEAWPPVLTRGEPRARGDARQGLLGTTERRGGALQVTYDGRPLYYYADESPGELRCHNIHHVGGLWLAVQPDGEPVPHNPDETVFLD